MLADPWVLAGRTAPSRVLFGPHVTNLGRGRDISDRHVAYYDRRARGGAGVIVTETASVHSSDWPYERAPLAVRCEDGWRSVAVAVHRSGTLLLASLGHTGLQGSTAYSQDVLWAPSPMAHVVSREMSIGLGDEEIEDLLHSTSHAAALALDAGCDGVELNVGQFSLFRQFLSGLTNERGDQWSLGPALALEALRRVRAEIGEAVLGLRLCADELAPWAGIVPEAAATYLAELAPMCDYVVVERGSIYSESQTRPDMQVAPGFNSALLDVVRDAVGATALVAQGSIVDPTEAEEMLRSGACTAVEMTRAQIADPDLVAKVRGERLGTVRPCVLCNQGCQVRDVRNPLVSCAVHPTAGHEVEESPLDEDSAAPTLAGRHVRIVGAGPAGCEAARRAALGGANVTLLDRRGEVGGSLGAAAALPGRARWTELVKWYRAELERLGVRVVAMEVPPGDVVDIVATGADDGRQASAALECRDGNDDSIPVVEVAQLPAGRFTHALVVDAVGGVEGVGAAESLATNGAVTLVTVDLVAGSQLSPSGDLVPANTRLAHLGVTLMTHSHLVGVSQGNALVEDRYDGEITSVTCDLIVRAGFRLPDSDPPQGERIGDAVAPRGVGPAILEARRAVASLGER